MPRTHPMTWVDAFTDRRFAGNPCAVVFDADDVAVETRLAFTRETRLSECAFLQHSDRADIGVRYYVASGEIPMAGHPTVATVVALVDAGMVALVGGVATFTLEVGAGVLPIEVTTTSEGLTRVSMTQLQPTFGQSWDPALIAPLVGLDPTDLRATPRTVSTGTPFLITPLTSHEALRRATLDVDALHAFHADHDTDFFEPFLTAMGGATPEGDVFSRLLLTPPEPPEDPFTGSATGCLGAWLWANGEIDRRTFVAEQGHDMGRPGRAGVEVLGPASAINGVRVSGTGVIVLRGHLDLRDGVIAGRTPSPPLAPQPIAAQPTGIAAFIGETAQNLDAGAVVVTSLLDYLRTFGEAATPGGMSPAVRAYFDNGGTRAVIAPAKPTPDGHAASRAIVADTTADLLVLPPSTSGGDVDAALVAAAVSWADDHGVLVLLDGRSDWSTVQDVLAGQRPDSPAAVLAFPRAQAPGGGQPQGVAGALAGVYARTDRTHGVWKAPAGAIATLRGVGDLTVDVGSRDVDALNAAGVVALRRHPREGIVAWGARTTSTDPEWRYVPVRRLATWIEASLRGGLDWATFEPNDEPLWAAVRGLAQDFLATVFRQGGLAGDRPEEAFFVRCDRTTMDEDDVDSGVLVLEVGVAPLRPGEFVVIHIRHQVGQPSA